jgi:ABC-type uncharacterized transport system YnjBCD ATPase subunit
VAKTNSLPLGEEDPSVPVGLSKEFSWLEVANTSPREFLYFEQREVVIPGIIMVHSNQSVDVVGKVEEVVSMVRRRH